MESSKRVAILGGGVCGLYAARVLSRAGVPVVLLDQGSRPGGLSGGRRRGDQDFDIGVHMLHETDREIWEDIRTLMGEESLSVRLDARIKWAGAFYRYPLRFGDMLKGIPFLRLSRCLLGLAGAHVGQAVFRKIPRNAEEALLQLYGRPLYELFFRDYTTRFWGLSPKELSASFVSAKMPRLSGMDAVKRVLASVGIKETPGRAVESALREENLHYSPSGAAGMIGCLVSAIEKNGGIILSNSEVSRILLRDGQVAAVRFKREGTETEMDCLECLSTVPISRLVRMIAPSPPDDVLDSVGKLRFKPIAVYGLVVKRGRCLEALYVYFRDRIFHRLSEPKNAGMRVSSSAHTVLLAEMTCEIGDGIWLGNSEARERVISDLQAEGICGRGDIEEIHVLTEETGYPVFSLGFESHYEKIRSWIDAVANLQSAGRQGDFKYYNMHAAMRAGADAARKILDHRAPHKQNSRAQER